MPQNSQEQGVTRSPLAQRLFLLSAREQIEILLRTTGSVSNKERLEIFGSAGFHFLRRKATRVALSLFLKRFVRTSITTVIYIVVLIICLLAFALLQSNPAVFIAVMVTLIAFFIGSFIANIVDFCREALPFIMTTTSRDERARLVRTIDGLEQHEKVGILRAISLYLLRRRANDSVIGSFLSGILVALIGSGLTILVMIIGLNMSPSAVSSLPLVVALVAFPAGYLFPGWIQNGIEKLLAKLKRKFGLGRDQN